MTTEPTDDDAARREPEATADAASAEHTSATEEAPGRNEGAPGAEIGIADESASTFEPEEDPEGHN